MLPLLPASEHLQSALESDKQTGTSPLGGPSLEGLTPRQRETRAREAGTQSGDAPAVTCPDGCPIPEALKFKFLCELAVSASFFLEGRDEKQGLLLKAPLSSHYPPDTDAARMLQCLPLSPVGAAVGQLDMKRASP